MLIFAGIAGVLLSVGLALSLLLSFMSAATLIAGVLYLVAVDGAWIATGGRRGAPVWAFRLLTPVPVALLAWWGLWLLGL